MSLPAARARRLGACLLTMLSVLLVAQFHVSAGARPPTMAPVRVWQDTITLPTYDEGLPDPNPPFDLFATNRFNYPYTLRQNLTDRRVPRAWRALHLENEYLACTVLPDLGGHLYRCIDKVNGADLFYANPSIKFARIAYRGAWTALGIEFNFPVSHNWMTASPVDFATTRAKDGSASIWVGNIDRAYGMQWRVELTLRPARAVLEQHTTLYNRSDTRHRFYWWTNAGVQVQDDSRILYPMRFTAAHGFADIDTWPVNSAGVDLSVVGNHTFGPVSRFAYGSREPFMAVYHPRGDSGVVHYSSPTDLPAKKIWSWSSDADGLDWRRALSDNNSAYVEVQAGLFRNQETYAFLEPQESIHFSEYWLPVRGTGGVARANAAVALNTSRPSAGVLRVAMNVTRAFPNATVTVVQSGRTVSKNAMPLTPARVFVRDYPVVDGPATVVVRDGAGQVVIEHTENAYDYVPASEVTLGRQAVHAPPAADVRSEEDWLAIGTQQELDGQLLIALDTYQTALFRFPESVGLNRAAGRLAVGLKQYERARECLSKVLGRISTDREAAYYLALATIWQDAGTRAAAGRPSGAPAPTGQGFSLAHTKALTLLETAQAYGTHRPAALFALAALTSRDGDKRAALGLLQRAVAEQPDAVRVGCVEVALLRSLGHSLEAQRRLTYWSRRDPTSSFLRYEATILGRKDEALSRHLAGDPERILEIAVDYIRFGLFAEALDILSRTYPTDGRVAEPGMPTPARYPLIAYYRAYCRQALGQDANKDRRDAAGMPATYVFPNRADTVGILRMALQGDASDANAHFLLGSLHLAGGLVDEALEEWEAARKLNPNIPVLHRNMGLTLLQMAGTEPPVQTARAGARNTRSAQSALDRAVAVLEEGTKVDRDNVGLYVALEQAMTRAGRPAEDRAHAILSFPDQRALPVTLVFRLASALAEAGRFEEAERQFDGRFFAREEGGLNVRQVYLEVRARHAAALAAQGHCAEALDIISRLAQPVAGLAFTRDGLEPFLKRGVVLEMVAKVRGGCR